MRNNMDRLFFDQINKSLFDNRLSGSQKSGINYKLAAFELHNIKDVRWKAYMLATSFHETARTMQPVEEIGKGRNKPYGKRYKYNGEHYTNPDNIYFGRGDIQLTWFENYELMGRLLNLPLLERPELALQPDISARIMIIGMTRGLFTGVSLSNFFNSYKNDPFNARKIVNGIDRAKLIEGYYFRFLEGLNLLDV